MTTLQLELSVYSQALDLRTQRHQVLASNIANADTPNYKARDFNFEAAMKNAMAGRGDAGSLALSTTSVGHLAGGGGGLPALQFTMADHTSWVRRIAGHVETGKTSTTDPAATAPVTTAI